MTRRIHQEIADCTPAPVFELTVAARPNVKGVATPARGQAA